MFLINEIKGQYKGWKLQRKAQRLIKERIELLINKEI